MRARLAVLLSTALVIGLMALPAGAAADAAPPPLDYIAQADQLSQVAYGPEQIETITLPVTGADGISLYVEVTKPKGVTDLPVILESSVYHGTLADRKGTRVFPDPVDDDGNKIGLTGYFAPRGYAVAMMSLRGSGRSGGCLDHLGQNDLEDIRRTIEALADAPWSNGRVGMAGHSYVAATQALAAASGAEGLVTIVPSAGLASMYDHQFHFGVPWLLQYAGPVFAYELLALQRHLPPGFTSPLGGGTGDDFGNNVQYTGCGLPNTATTAGSGQATGQYELWHAQRDHRRGATDSDVAVFMVHGVNDNAARIPAAEWFFGQRFDRSRDKVWLGQWDHGSNGNTRCGEARVGGHPTCRFDQWQYALHAWFDFHLKQMDVDTGPAVEVFLNDADPRSAAGQGPVWTADAWSRPAYTELYLDVAAQTVGATRPATNAQRSFTLAHSSSLVNAGGEGPTLRMPVTEDTLLIGLPTLTLYASLATSQVQHLVVEIARESAGGGSEPVAYCAIQPSLRFGVETLAPVIPGQVMKLQPQCFTMAHQLFAGDTLAIQVGAYSPHHVQASAEGQVTIFSGPGFPSRLTTPLQPNATTTTYPDVERFAQPR